MVASELQAYLATLIEQYGDLDVRAGPMGTLGLVVRHVSQQDARYGLDPCVMIETD